MHLDGGPEPAGIGPRDPNAGARKTAGSERHYSDTYRKFCSYRMRMANCDFPHRTYSARIIASHLDI